jgi:hypothetical protein
VSVHAPLSPDQTAPRGDQPASRPAASPAAAPSPGPVSSTVEAPKRQTTRLLSPQTRKLAVAIHIIVSVGLLGVSAAFLVLSTAALLTADATLSQAAYRVMGIFTRGPVPVLAVSALVSGIVLSLGTKWGLFQHTWIVVKLVMTVAVILNGAFVIGPGVDRAYTATVEATSLAATGDAPMVLLVANLANVLMLGAATAISVYKPWGALPGRQPARG